MSRQEALLALGQGQMIRPTGRNFIYRLGEDGIESSDGIGDWFPCSLGLGPEEYELITEVEITTTLME